MTAHICKNCKITFNSWYNYYKCQHCIDEISDNVRDIDFRGDSYGNCYVCKGTGEEKILEMDFCSEDCIDEYQENIELL